MIYFDRIEVVNSLVPAAGTHLSSPSPFTSSPPPSRGTCAPAGAEPFHVYLLRFLFSQFTTS